MMTDTPLTDLRCLADSIIRWLAFPLSLIFLIGTFNAKAADEEVLEILAVNWPPYEFEKPEDGLKGFDVEVVEEVFQRMGKPAKVVFRPWARAKKLVFEGRGFALLSCSYRKEREEFVHFTDPISQTTHGFFYHRQYGGELPDSVEAFRGHTVAVVRDYSQHSDLKKLNIEAHVVNSDRIAITVVAKERVEFAYIPKEVAALAAKQLGFTRDLAYKPFRTNSLHLCISRKWPKAEDFVLRFNKGLDEVQEDGTFAAIHSKYGADSLGS